LASVVINYRRSSNLEAAPEKVNAMNRPSKPNTAASATLAPLVTPSGSRVGFAMPVRRPTSAKSSLSRCGLTVRTLLHRTNGRSEEPLRCAQPGPPTPVHRRTIRKSENLTSVRQPWIRQIDEPIRRTTTENNNEASITAGSKKPDTCRTRPARRWRSPCTLPDSTSTLVRCDVVGERHKERRPCANSS